MKENRPYKRYAQKTFAAFLAALMTVPAGVGYAYEAADVPEESGQMLGELRLLQDAEEATIQSAVPSANELKSYKRTNILHMLEASGITFEVQYSDASTRTVSMEEFLQGADVLLVDCYEKVSERYPDLPVSKDTEFPHTGPYELHITRDGVTVVLSTKVGKDRDENWDLEAVEVSPSGIQVTAGAPVLSALEDKDLQITVCYRCGDYSRLTMEEFLEEGGTIELRDQPVTELTDFAEGDQLLRFSCDQKTAEMQVHAEAHNGTITGIQASDTALESKIGRSVLDTLRNSGIWFTVSFQDGTTEKLGMNGILPEAVIELDGCPVDEAAVFSESSKSLRITKDGQQITLDLELLDPAKLVVRVTPSAAKITGKKDRTVLGTLLRSGITFTVVYDDGHQEEGIPMEEYLANAEVLLSYEDHDRDQLITVHEDTTLLHKKVVVYIDQYGVRVPIKIEAKSVESKDFEWTGASISAEQLTVASGQPVLRALRNSREPVAVTYRDQDDEILSMAMLLQDSKVTLDGAAVDEKTVLTAGEHVVTIQKDAAKLEIRLCAVDGPKGITQISASSDVLEGKIGDSVIKTMQESEILLQVAYQNVDDELIPLKEFIEQAEISVDGSPVEDSTVFHANDGELVIRQGGQTVTFRLLIRDPATIVADAVSSATMFDTRKGKNVLRELGDSDLTVTVTYENKEKADIPMSTYMQDAEIELDGDPVEAGTVFDHHGDQRMKIRKDRVTLKITADVEDISGITPPEEVLSCVEGEPVLETLRNSTMQVDVTYKHGDTEAWPMAAYLRSASVELDGKKADEQTTFAADSQTLSVTRYKKAFTLGLSVEQKPAEIVGIIPGAESLRVTEGQRLLEVLRDPELRITVVYSNGEEKEEALAEYLKDAAVFLDGAAVDEDTVVLPGNKEIRIEKGTTGLQLALLVEEKPAEGGGTGGSSGGTGSHSQAEQTAGNRTVTERKQDGTVVETTTMQDGTAVVVVKLSAAAAEKAAPVLLPVSPVKVGDRMTLQVYTGLTEPAAVTIPVRKMSAGTVVIRTASDGTAEVVRNAVPAAAGMTVSVRDGDKLTIEDRSRTFRDVPADHWAAEQITFVTARGLYHGTDADTFSPDQSMTRGMLAQVLYRLENTPAVSVTDRFRDVTEGLWCADAVSWASQQGIIYGYADETFRAGEPITREQLAVMLYRWAGSPRVLDGQLDFADAVMVSDFASDAMLWAVQNGVIGGTEMGLLNPHGLATRAQVAAMLARFLTR